MGLFSFVGSLLGGSAQKKSVKKATQQQVDALNRAIDVTTKQNELTRQDLSPWRTEGAAAVNQYGDLVGTHGGEKQQSAIDALRESPFYKTLFRTGEEEVLQNASATGGIRGGNTQRGLADFGADTLMKTIMQQLSSLGGLSTTGLNAAAQTGQFGENAANNVAGFNVDQGKARASGSLAIGGINNQMWNNAGAFLDQAVQAALGAGAGGGGGGFNFGTFLKGF